MHLTIPDFSLVLMMGASGSGKSTFAAKHFLPTEILSSDRCRGLVADNENDGSATGDAFDVLYYIAAKRLAAHRLTVIDATNLRPEDRRHAIDVARQFHALPVVIALDVPESVCLERNREREDRTFGAHVVRSHLQLMRRSLKSLGREGFRIVQVLRSVEDAETATLSREPLYNDRRDDHGPFDIIGDVHGCYDELVALLSELGYQSAEQATAWRHPEGRRLIFLGDVVDRGPRIPDALRLVMDQVTNGGALCVPGNHEQKLARKLQGKDVSLAHGLAETISQMEDLPADEQVTFARDAREFIDKLTSHYWLDDGKLVVAHAGLKAEMQGRGSAAVRSFAMFGETTGETDEFGLPVRADWAASYRGDAIVVYGHTPVPEAEWLNKTICIDTGCVFGGKLTALRYPELEFVSVPAASVYNEPVRPLTARASNLSAQQEADDLLDMEDVSGKRTIATRYQTHVVMREENAAAALEVMSRFAVDPRWLIHLPPTMSPSETSKRDGMLEHPEDALAYYASAGFERVVVEEKHMGSRAVIVICRDGDAARARFGVSGMSRGIIYTRTGRAFFSEAAVMHDLLERLGAALERAEFWDRFATTWACIDAEILPWSAKAQALIDEQYAPVGFAAIAGLTKATALIDTAVDRGVDAQPLHERFTLRKSAAERYDVVWKRFAERVESVADLRIAPFHLLATEGAVHDDKSHSWHMETLAGIAGCSNGNVVATAWRSVDLAETEAVAAAIAWWQDLTARGGEGAVVKPDGFVPLIGKRLFQPALKSRGVEYLRMIYGPEYTLPEHLERLRARGLAGKRKQAIGEFSLGLEALHRFVDGAPLGRVHECVFGVLALESEPIDPRL